jgi:hypothetical protein
VSDDWLNQLRQLHDADKARLEAEAHKTEASQQQALARLDEAVTLLRHVKAHELLRQVQKALLDGKGTLGLHQNPKDYDRAIVLAWTGSIGDAKRPNLKSSEPYHYIMVAARDGKLWINDMALSVPTSAAMKKALLEAAKNPATQHKQKAG